MHHKRKRAANQRAGCKLCKPWKTNGYRTGRRGGESMGAHRSRSAAAADLRDYGGDGGLRSTGASTTAAQAELHHW